MSAVSRSTAPAWMQCAHVLLSDAGGGLWQVSYMILQRVSPVTHSIGNCLKRVIVIVASVIIFQNPMSQQNMLGTSPAPALQDALEP